jgi:hypothetical protein
MNSVIHGKNHYTAMNWADFCEVVKRKVDEQKKEIEYALTGCEYVKSIVVMLYLNKTGGK